MARRKNVKRIDPRYFLHETATRNDDGSAMEEHRIQLNEEPPPPGLATTATMLPVAAPDEGRPGILQKVKDTIVAIADSIAKGLSPSPEYMESLNRLATTNPELYEKVLSDISTASIPSDFGARREGAPEEAE